ncbi:sporulation integral membrane protein YtvI [Savagea sp. SN6]|uniref:Sporulation integral membrane protein YtvI n=1 Tax=Savagea serpentis TaxID=2785297 RepID=A0A8J7KBD6_9BACL|nr:sporulation integral membrane protein YtvI [Savagea serpentis]MBF4500302.1 sporulation integral membrane protein YtvI [Savagea serpentis]
MDTTTRTEKQRTFIIRVAYIAIILTLIVLFFKYVFPVIMPFVIAFLIAAVCMPIVRWLTKRTPLHNVRVWALIVIFALYTLIGSLITWLVFKSLGWIGDAVKQAPHLYYDSILPALEKVKEWSEAIFARISPELSSQYRSMLNDVLKSITNAIISWSGDLAGIITSFSLSLPSFFITVSFALLASIFIIWDFDQLKQFFLAQLQPKTITFLSKVKNSFGKSVFDYIKAYMIIASITFVELAIGFLIIGLPNAIGIAAGIAIFDMIPVFGTGGIMVPWIIIAFLNGNITLGIQLAVIYGVVTLVRNVMEPKVVGTKLGLNTVLALFVMYVGLKVFGFIGMIFAPIVTVMVINFNKTENMNWWKPVPKKRKEKIG